MKKLFVVLFVAAVMVAGLFAEETLEFPKGTWIDTNYNAEWVLGAGSVELYDGTTGELIYSFTKDKRENEKLEMTTEGLSWSFVCPETYRRYYFIKPLTMAMSADILLQIDPDWTHEDYKVEIYLKK